MKTSFQCSPISDPRNPQIFDNNEYLNLDPQYSTFLGANVSLLTRERIHEWDANVLRNCNEWLGKNI